MPQPMYLADAPPGRLLENGLQVQLLQRPGLKQAAAYLRVHAGSHDVPVAWPGLAHFLEHLFFLGTERFQGEEGLMAFVQRHGGQINARTNERTTDYFFQVPTMALAGGLERLCDMLGHLRMNPADQLREREVLHAEFIAWSRDASTHHEAWLTSPLNPSHPLRAFHAGNRYSLAIPREAFQQGLRGFYQRFYHAAQMTLCLVSPQPVDTLHAIAEHATRHLPKGVRVPQQAPPILRGSAQPIQDAPDNQRLNLVFAAEHLPEAAAQAMEFIGLWIASEHSGGLLDVLRQRGWVESIKLKMPYRFAGQGVIDLEWVLTEKGQQARAQITEHTFDWLDFFATQHDWPELCREYAQLIDCRLEVSSPLELARYTLELRSGELAPAVRQLLACLRPEHLIHPLVYGGPPELPTTWQVPPGNRFLRACAPETEAVADISGLCYIGAEPPQAALYLRWSLEHTVPPRLGSLLEKTLQPLFVEARQAGILGDLSAQGSLWTLKLTGLVRFLPNVLESCLAILSNLLPDSWSEIEEPVPPALMPIRELLRQLSRRGSANVDDKQPGAGTIGLMSTWARSRWEGLAIGFEGPARNALNRALAVVPANPMGEHSTGATAVAGRRWREIHLDTAEHAILMFCPVPGNGLLDEAAWRWLAYFCQGPFYQRLRVELQLGYAVFSDFRQVEGRGGLLFGVQSPGVDPAQLLAHIETFMRDLHARVAALDESTRLSQCAELATRFNPAVMDLPQLAERLWQAQLAGHTPDYLEHLGCALRGLSRADVQRAANDWLDAAGGWEVLATSACPDERWLEVR